MEAKSQDNAVSAEEKPRSVDSPGGVISDLRTQIKVASLEAELERRRTLATGYSTLNTKIKQQSLKLTERFACMELLLGLEKTYPRFELSFLDHLPKTDKGLQKDFDVVKGFEQIAKDMKLLNSGKPIVRPGDKHKSNESGEVIDVSVSEGNDPQ